MATPRGLLLVLALALAGCGGGGGEAQTTESSAGGAAGCRSVEPPATREPASLQAPAVLLDATKTYRAVVSTSCGSFTVTLDEEASPNTVASFVALAEADYFDGTFFHRIVPGFVIQGGDPTGTGGGGPGYSTVDTPADTTTYTEGVVAMAKTAVEAPGTAGSQFFVVTAPDAGLPPEYAVIGKVTDGLDVVRRIAVLGDPATEQPTQPVVVDDVRIETA